MMSRDSFKLYVVILLSSLIFSLPRSYGRTHYNTRGYTSVPSFSHIYTQGQIDITLHTGYRDSSVAFQGDPRDLHEISWSVTHGILNINLGHGYPKYGRVHLDIRTHYLSTFSYQGSGTIVGSDLYSNGLDLILNNAGNTTLAGHIVLRTLNVQGKGSTQISGIHSRQLRVKLSGGPRVQLSGVANIALLKITGKAWFSLYWVNSARLLIRARNAGFIQLAGVTKMLDVELWGNSRFNGRYLRATRAFIKTHGHSEADIAVVKRQHTLATDASNIYFYNLPEMKADFMGFNGAVLDMRDWTPPIFKEPTRYTHGG